MKNINIVYHSSTGNVKRFLDKVQAHATSVGLSVILYNVEETKAFLFKGNFHIFTPTRGFGQIPEVISSFLNGKRDRVLSISGSGNRNWGVNFCGAVDKLHTIIGAPIFITIELEGLEKEVVKYVELLKQS